ncbi:peptidoglycan DD-metalloendopeptidase family protein [Nocardioides anomalus]|uniref:Peptidoglycan DD-metalloendopeptidase family protein n=1 Tax=Nocardioides anomalus TaxID=2712223 RepID=A0A6G6W9L3_9ACTN|nr:M23 family metallopeptidase [Nocardioides anomalus]QIG41912.1 peptidoglycan DD-metalloendopeptidase family protein [Nocardioides anomalus]
MTLALLTTLGTLGSAVPLAHADGTDDLKHKHQDVQAQIEQAQESAEEASKAVNRAKSDLATAESQLADAQVSYAGAQAHVSDVQAQLADAQAVDAQMQAALQAAQADLAQAKAEVRAGQAALDAQQQAVKDSVVSVYQQGSPELMAWTGYLQSQTPSDLIRKMEYADTLIEDQNTVFDQLHAAELALRAERDEVRTAEQAADEQADRAAQQLVNVQQLEQEATEAANDALLAQDQVTLTVAARAKAQRKAERAKRQDLEQLEKLKKQEARIKAQILAAAAADQSAGYVGDDDGFLLPPVTGAVTSPFGYRIHPIYGYWGLHDGTDFGVSCGEGMRAAADGKVLSRYYSPVYGNRLYVDVGKVNGHALTVVYNHATSYRVDVGDHVTRGEVVGYVGSTGWSTGCHLHFTVLQDGTAVDPMNYL